VDDLSKLNIANEIKSFELIRNNIINKIINEILPPEIKYQNIDLFTELKKLKYDLLELNKISNSNKINLTLDENQLLINRKLILTNKIKNEFFNSIKFGINRYSISVCLSKR
jgi:hypothetical protein